MSGYQRIHIFCEGQTEEVFVREVLAPHFASLGIWLNPIIVRTGPQGKGGVVSYGKIQWQIKKKCREDVTALVTTLFDFYALPGDFPGMNQTFNDSMAQAHAVKMAFEQDIGQANFIAFLAVHEFEALLFSQPGAFGAWFDQTDLVPALQAIRDSVPSPEHINDGASTAPSKRILNLCASYDKVMHGSLIALDIGLEAIRQACPLFDAWVRQMETAGER